MIDNVVNEWCKKYKLSKGQTELIVEIICGNHNGSNSSVLKRLNITRHTLDNHIYKIYLKINVSSRTELLVRFIKENLKC